MFGLPVAHLRFLLQAQAAGRLPPYAGSALRGSLAAAYKQTVCVVAHRDCPQCHLRPVCTYPLIFEPPPRPDVPLLGAEGVPPAYVLRPPPGRDWHHPTPQSIRPGQAWTFDLLLFGPAIAQFPLLLYAAQRAFQRGLGGQRIPFRVLQVSQVHPRDRRSRNLLPGRSKLSYRNPCVVVLRPPRRTRPVERLRIRLLTPLRLKQGGRYRFDARLDTLMAVLLRRLSRLGLLYGTGPIEEYRDLLAVARQVRTVRQDLAWVDWTRYSRRQATLMQ
ncbi:MAG: hypothetical protein NZ742_12715, partial [Acidobacteria bacterium]|nr:hypothetical protein [Acidobacteriota bacterium]